MKNKLSGFVKIVTVLSACLLFASFSPSLDGRAVVVDEGVFPQGLFAKTVGYLPGDIISVASISTDTTVDLLVIGALDPSEGVAIMLSPEAASAIGIEKSANNIVKITKRSGQDDRVYGTAVIAKNNVATDYTPTEAEEFDSTIANEDEETFDDSEAEEFEEEEEAFEEETADEEIDAEETVEEEPAEETIEEAVEEEAVEEEEPAEIEETLEEEQIEETAEPLEEETEVEEEVPEYETITAEEEEPEVEEEAPIEENVEEEAEEDIEAEPFEEEELAEPEEEIESEAVDADELEDLPKEETVEEAPVEETPEDEIPVEEESESEAEAEAEDEDILDEIMEAELEEYEESQEYEAIVLVPTDSNPPEEETETVEEVEDIEEIESVENTVEEISEVVEEITENVPNVVEETTTPVVNAPKSYKKYMVGSLSDLKSGSYYIQIAALSNDENILEIIGKYAKNYPITIVPMAGGIRKQVMIGPLNMDEYAVVLERFKSYGYKDAFLRKIK